MGRESDKAFMEWAESMKECKYCGIRFFGPVCECERRRSLAILASAQRTQARLSLKRIGRK